MKGYFSKKMEAICGSFVYKDDNNKDIIVTEVYHDDRESSSKWDDLIYVGEVISFVGTHKSGIHWPEVFLTGNIPQDKHNLSEIESFHYAKSMVLLGWANYEIAKDYHLPDRFGYGMIKLKMFGNLDSIISDDLISDD